MGTTISNADVAQLAQIGLVEATKLIPAFNAFSTTFRSDLTYEDVTKVPVYSASGASSKWDDATNNYSHSNGVIAFKDSVLSERYKESFEVRDYLSGKIDKVKCIQVATNKVLRDALAGILASVTNANYGAAGVAGVAAADFGEDDLEILENLADDADWGDDRSLILKPTYYNRLVKTYGANFVLGGDGQIIRSAKLGEVLGFNSVRCRVPDNSEHLVGFACTMSALAAVVGNIKPADTNTISYEVAEDPSGFILGVRQYYEHSLGRELVSVEILTTPGMKGTGELKRITAPAV